MKRSIYAVLAAIAAILPLAPIAVHDQAYNIWGNYIGIAATGNALFLFSWCFSAISAICAAAYAFFRSSGARMGVKIFITITAICAVLCVAEPGHIACFAPLTWCITALQLSLTVFAFFGFREGDPGSDR